MKQLGQHPFEQQQQRKTPRILFNPPERVVLVQLEDHVGVLNDISAGGLSLLLAIPLTARRKVGVNIDGRIRGKGDVVEVRMTEDEHRGFRATYRNGIRFATDEEGYRCVVQVLKLVSDLPKLEVLAS
jgi:hypothetical protein